MYNIGTETKIHLLTLVLELALSDISESISFCYV